MQELWHLHVVSVRFIVGLLYPMVWLAIEGIGHSFRGISPPKVDSFVADESTNNGEEI